MSVRTDYTDDEWFVLWKPIAEVPTAVMVCHPAHLTREAFAADAALKRVAEQGVALLQRLFEPPVDEAEWLSHRLDLQRRNRGEVNVQQFQNLSLEECRAAVALLERVGTQPEVDAYKRGLFQTALAVANAGKEGEFLGLGGVRLDESEKVYLRDLAEVLALSWSDEQ